MLRRMKEKIQAWKAPKDAQNCSLEQFLQNQVHESLPKNKMDKSLTSPSTKEAVLKLNLELQFWTTKYGNTSNTKLGC